MDTCPRCGAEIVVMSRVVDRPVDGRPYAAWTWCQGCGAEGQEVSSETRAGAKQAARQAPVLVAA